MKEKLEVATMICFILLTIVVVLKAMPYRIRSIFRRRRRRLERDDSLYERIEELELSSIHQQEFEKKTKKRLKKLKPKK